MNSLGGYTSLLLVLLLGCSGASENEEFDATSANDSTSTVDVGVVDASLVDDTAPTMDGCTLFGFEAETSAAQTQIPGRFLYHAERSHDGLYDRLEFDFFQGGIFDGPTGPGSYDLSGSTYSTCQTCVRLFKDCNAQGDCAQVFFATEGSLEITLWDDTAIKGSFSQARLKEVNTNNPIAIMPKLDGDHWCLDGNTFNFPTDAESKPNVAEPSCVEEGTGSFIGYNVANLSLTNCLGESVKLHDQCGQRKAIWIMGTTGWCTACSIHLKAMASEHGGVLTRDKIHEFTPGLDLLVVLSQNAAHEAPTQAYCEAYAANHSIDPAMVLLDYNPGGAKIPVKEPIGETHTYQSMATTWTLINPYVVEAESGGVLSSFPWNALLRGSNMEYFWSDYCGTGSLEHAQELLLAE